MNRSVVKQRVEVRPAPRVSPSSLLAAAPANVAVIDQKAAPLTWVDRAKAYYHTIFAAISGLAVLIVEVAPDLNAIPGLPPTWRHIITAAVVIANAIATRAKPNEVWVQ